MKALLFVLVLFLISVLPASAANTSQANGTAPTRIAELYSDIESFDVTLYSIQPEENLTLEVSLIRSENGNKEVIATQEFSTGSLPANTRVTKVGLWDVRNAERGAYTLRARLLEQGQILSESEYDFVYGGNSASRLRVDDLIPNSEGITVILSPNQASLFDLEYMLVDGHDVLSSTKTEKASLTSIPEAFSASWETLLENNREYTGRVKVRVYSPNRGFIASTENFTARDDAKITDIYEDETGASATVLGRSQVPFEGSLAFSVYKLNENFGTGNAIPIESVQERVPVLLNNDDETVEIAWSQKLPEGVYRLEIELLGNNGDVIEHRETVIESDLSLASSLSSVNNSTSETEASSGKRTPGFSASSLISGLVAVFVLFKEAKLKQNTRL
ncbi:hypothetical protein [Methanosarcina acetivorans]|uniref:Uncharacterized protein n=1 Tax=Methanosarcina acetivorans (strain ATCC 35395 / DSM 2834 / JCM 12185 / C2A) TaxID=188937 RepID=Q8TN02_METAC|nr:hypothetical protein [Methanosarcina acetivorans]AAM05877.1 predicted protein [Methanosarcina acetivorans C2A]